ncbi:MAG TPA: hypothetical protein VKW04_14150 [Planctomycetota bacterium]|nr:hypothetical protein [Planctomycetota bacterium]
MTTVDLRDPDGAYVLARPIDDARCRVLASNRWEKDVILFKDSAIGWSEASRDLGGFTRLGPGDLEPVEGEPDEVRSLDADGEAEDAGPAGAAEEDQDPLERIPDPRSLPDRSDGDAGPGAALLRMLAHYGTAHAERPGGVLPQNVCRCPGFRPDRSPSAIRLHVLAALATAATSLPDLERLVGAFRRFSAQKIPVG